MTFEWTRTWGMALGVAGALACASTANKSGDNRAEAKTEDGQRVAVEADPSRGADERSVAEAQAHEQATSTRPTEGGGGKNPHPLPTEQGGERTFGGDMTAPPAKQQGRVAQASGDQVEGRVALIDRQTRELVVDMGTSTRQVKVAQDAEVTIDGAEASFAEIPQGSAIRATLEQRSGDDEPAVTRLDVTRSKK